jgi:membrane dipeptidase
MDRRSVLLGAAASSLALAAPANAGDTAGTYIADMHAHLFFFGKNTPSSRPLGKSMARGNATLVAWSLVGDVPWIRPSARGLRQIGSPKAGETVKWFQEELRRVKAHIADQKLEIVRTAKDVDLALKGVPHVVLAVEGASFLDGDLSQLRVAYDEGIRHIQLVHYIRNPIGDFQTERPTLNGLSGFGKDVVQECNRLGILVDLAHCTREVVEQALVTSTAPVVWSHSSVTKDKKPNWQMVPWRARQLGLDEAKAIAAKGGVVGLWGLKSDVGPNVEAYADRLLQMAEWLGDDHVGFGSDMNAISNPILGDYVDLQRVVRIWQKRGIDAARIRKMAIGNYARVLRRAFESARA